MGITAKELARKLNLSAAAVSMALNHKPGVSTATRQLVLDAAEKYGYDFSRIAEKHTTSGAIYFVIYKKHGTVVADTPFFSQVSEGISQGCKKNDYRLKISYIYEDEDTITKQIEEIQCGQSFLFQCQSAMDRGYASILVCAEYAGRPPVCICGCG